MRRLFLFLVAACSWAAFAWAAEQPSAPASETPAEPLPTLDGVLVNRPGGVIMQLKMEDLALVLRFFDAEHKPVKPDVDGGLLRAIPSGRNPERRALVPTSDGMGLTHGQPLRKPHVFKLHIALTHAGSDEAAESYTVDYP